MNQTLAPPEAITLLPRPVLVEGKQDLNTVTDAVCKIVEEPPPRWWWPAFGLTSALVLCAFFCIGYLVSTGVGVWGLNSPVGWAFDITNFVFWVGIGHAGTLISAILLLLRQKWRTSINRFAEAMTLFAVLCAAVYPTIHVGRIWVLYYFAPVPNAEGVWPNFSSPLLWDMFALSTYGTVSLLFWYIGLIPDLATLRDRATTKWRQYAYGVLALGWRGSGRHWRDYELACLILAGLATPLVVSVHTIVSFDFATSQVPGWHATIFPPYFVAGAIFSGFAMVLTLMIPVRELFNLKHLITDKHLDNMCKVILATGMMVGFAYATEFFMAWYGGDPYEQIAFKERLFGPSAWAYWIMVSCNVLSPQVFWIKKYRYQPWLIFGVSILVNVGMWFERFVIIATSLQRDRLPSSWGIFEPTWVDGLQMLGVFGLFFMLVLIFIRVLPLIAISEVKVLLPESDPHHHPENNGQHATTPGNVVPFTGTIPGAVVGRFANAADLMEAAKRTLAAGYTRFDTHSPFPIHGMDKAMGMSASKLPWMVLAGGITGCALALCGMLYVNVIDYPLIKGGKPYGALEPLMPITFEVTVLLSAFATVGGLFFLCGLPRLYHTLFRQDAFARATIDGFFLSVEASDPLFNLRETPAFIASLGGTDVTVTEA